MLVDLRAASAWRVAVVDRVGAVAAGADRCEAVEVVAAGPALLAGIGGCRVGGASSARDRPRGLLRRWPDARASGVAIADAAMMLGSSRALRVWAYPKPTDLRKGYDGLYGLTKHGLGRDPLSG